MSTIEIPCPDLCSPWATRDDCIGIDDLDPNLVDEQLQIATFILFQLDGMKYPGVCSDTVRPTSRQLNRDHGRGITLGWNGQGYYPGAYFGGGYSPGGWCSCNTEGPGQNMIPEVSLGVFPLVGISYVKIDGVILPETDPDTGGPNYQISDRRYLMRMANLTTRNNPGWPCCQRMDLPTSEVGTWEVGIVYGSMPPKAGIRACADLATEMSKALTPKAAGECRLPRQTTQIVRQGVTAVVRDPNVFVVKVVDGVLDTGLPSVNAFLAADNPARTQRPAVILSPDIRRRTSQR